MGIGERLENVEKKAEQIGNALADKGGDLLDSRMATQENGAVTFSGWEADESVSLTKSQMAGLRKIFGKGRSLPENYKPQFKSFSHFLREGFKGTDEFNNLHKSSIDQLKKAVDAHNTLDSDSAGMLVLPEFAPDIAEILYDENDLMGMTDQYTVTGNRMSFPRVPSRSRATGQRHGGLTASWLDEGDTIPTSRARLESTELRLKKLGVTVFLTEELLEDNSYALEQWITRAVRDEIRFMTGNALVNGGGGGRPLGYLQSGARATVAKETGQAADTVVAANVLNMYMRRRPNVNIGEYEWHINQNIEPQLQQMTLGTAGSQQVVYMPPGGLSAAPYATLMGLRVRATEFNPILGNEGDIALVRMKGYTTISKGGINEMASQHVEFLRDQTAIKFTIRLDGRPLVDEPTTPFQSNGADLQSDFITLAERA